MLRIATDKDFELIKSMVLQFAYETEYKDYVDPVKLGAVIEDMLEGDPSKKIIILHGDVGIIAGVINPIMLGTALMSTEVIWWVEPEHRNNAVGVELLEAYENWAKSCGCKLTTMVCLDDSVGKLYEKLGYTLRERTYLKEV